MLMLLKSVEMSVDRSRSGGGTWGIELVSGSSSCLVAWL